MNLADANITYTVIFPVDCPTLFSEKHTGGYNFHSKREYTNPDSLVGRPKEIGNFCLSFFLKRVEQIKTAEPK